jgi:hypothetical protein
MVNKYIMHIFYKNVHGQGAQCSTCVVVLCSLGSFAIAHQECTHTCSNQRFVKNL